MDASISGITEHMEASDSGLFHHLGKVAGSKGSREFKSHRLRLRSPKRRATADAVRRQVIAKESFPLQ